LVSKFLRPCQFRALFRSTPRGHSGAEVRVCGGRQQISHAITMLAPISRWFFFTVIPAVMPIVWLFSKLRARRLHPDMDVLLGKGELFLACSAFAAFGIGEILASGKRRRLAKYIVGGCCLIVLMIAIDDYGDIGLMVQTGVCYDITYEAVKSLAMCVFSILCGAMCIALAGYK